MNENVDNSEIGEIIGILRTLPVCDIDSPLSEHIRWEARRILAQQKRVQSAWNGGTGRFYSGFMEPVLVSGLTLFYLLWAFSLAGLLLRIPL